MPSHHSAPRIIPRHTVHQLEPISPHSVIHKARQTLTPVRVHVQGETINRLPVTVERYVEHPEPYIPPPQRPHLRAVNLPQPQRTMQPPRPVHTRTMVGPPPRVVRASIRYPHLLEKPGPSGVSAPPHDSPVGSPRMSSPRVVSPVGGILLPLRPVASPDVPPISPTNEGNVTSSTPVAEQPPSTSISGRHVCKNCGNVYKRVSSLSRHKHECKAVIPSENQKPFQCSICLKNYLRSDYLIDHMRGIHGIGDMFVCECGEAFRWRFLYSSHRKACEIGSAALAAAAASQTSSSTSSPGTPARASQEGATNTNKRVSDAPVAEEKDTSDTMPTTSEDKTPTKKWDQLPASSTVEDPEPEVDIKPVINTNNEAHSTQDTVSTNATNATPDTCSTSASGETTEKTSGEM